MACLTNFPLQLFTTARADLLARPLLPRVKWSGYMRDYLSRSCPGQVPLKRSNIFFGVLAISRGIRCKSFHCSIIYTGTFLNSLAEIPMTIAIILLCFLLTYMVFLRFSVLFSLAFNCSIFLCHKLFGPRWIFDKLFWIGGVSFPILKFMARHYYITSVTIILIFVYTLVAPILRWSARRTARERRDIVFANIADLHERMGEIEERQQEILRILRDLDNERRMREEER